MDNLLQLSHLGLSNNSVPDDSLSLFLLASHCDTFLLLGASCAGAVATYTSLGTALELNGALTAGAMFWFASKNKHILKSFFASRGGKNAQPKL